MVNVTLEQFEALYQAAPAGTSRKRLARLLGVTLPEPTVSEQLQAAEFSAHMPKTSKEGSTPREKRYVKFPALKLSNGDVTQSIWVNAEVAREIFTRGLEICDQNNL